MVFDVAFIVFPQALPRGGVEDEGKGLERNGDADVQVSVDHVVVEDAGALLPTEGAPEQTGGVDTSPEDERWGDETCQKEEIVSGFFGSVGEFTAKKGSSIPGWAFVSSTARRICWIARLDSAVVQTAGSHILVQLSLSRQSHQALDARGRLN